jgi:DNA-binding MarR family transcriptional regulator
MPSYSQKYEIAKLRILQALSEPAAVESGITSESRVVSRGEDAYPRKLSVDGVKVLAKLVADGLVERRPHPHHNVAKPYFITLQGKDYLAAARERALFPEISRRQDWSARESGDNAQQTVADTIRRWPEIRDRAEGRKLRVLQLLSEPAEAEYGASASSIEDQTRSSTTTVEKLLKAMQADGVIERKPDPRNKSSKPVFITPKGRDYLAAATRDAVFPEIAQRQDWSTGQSDTELQRAVTDFIRSLAEFQASGEDRIQQVSQELTKTFSPAKQR